MERTNHIEETASEWLIRRDSGNWGAADQAEFEQWLDASTAHRVAFLRLEHAWENAGRLKALGAGIQRDLPPPPGQWNVGSSFVLHRPDGAPTAANEEHAPSRGRRAWFAAAASVALLLLGGVGLLSSQASGDEYSTPVGGLSKLPIEDGSRITLNTDSRLQVALSARERHISLGQGEAFFEVAKDPKRPFVVEVGHRRVTAVGTQFSVRRDGDAIEVVVTEGKVRVDPDIHGRRGANAAPVFLTAGHIARSNAAGLLVQETSLEEAESRLSWRSGVLTFRDLPLSDAVSEFNRYNTRKIVIADPAVAALRVEGNFRPTQSQAFVRLLEAGFPVRASLDGERIVLHSR